MKTGMFESISGNKSSSRLIGFIVIMVALAYSGWVIWLGRTDIVQSATAAGVLFITIAAPAMAFLFAQKGQEIKQETQQDEQK
jgi:hypothetical protein